MTYAPIALFVYSRLWHTRKTVDALLKNSEASQSDLIIFSDGAKNEESKGRVDEVRRYLGTIQGFRSIRIVERHENLGLARSIISGVSEVVNEYGRVIVMEDDLVVSPYFLRYMNESLNLYERQEEVISIHGYCYSVDAELPNTFLLQGADCWGWATWQRGWAYFNPDGSELLAALKQRRLLKLFDYNGAYSFSRMLAQQVKGKNDSWAIRWHASAFLAGKLTLYPGKSLVHNIGNDGSGTHCASTSTYDVLVSMNPVCVGGIEVRQLDAGRRAFEEYLRKRKVGASKRIFGRMQRLVRQVLP